MRGNRWDSELRVSASSSTKKRWKAVLENAMLAMRSGQAIRYWFGGMKVMRVASAAAMIGVVLVASCGPSGHEPQTDTELQEDARIQFLSDPEFGPVFQRMEVYYPTETQALLDETLAIYRRGGSQEEAGAVSRATMARILQRDTGHVANAEPAALRAIAQTTLSLLEVLQRTDLAACQEVLVQGDLSVLTRQRVSDEVHRALANGTVATLDAIQSGKSAPQTYARLTPEDYRLMFAHFAADEDARANLQTLMSGNGGAVAPDVACDTGNRMWSGILGAPRDLPERYISEIMSPAAAN
jgi:hypothetical protein